MADAVGGPGGSKWAADDLVARADVYDRAVGIVSGFQFLFTEQASLSPTVAHFERYPLITHPDGKEATPDFTVLFHDGGALVGEVAQLSLADQGVDALCRQIQRYDNLPYVQSADGGTVAPAWIDHVLIVQHGTGTAAVNRVIRDRLKSDGHWFTMSVAPCIVSAAPSEGGYVFARQGFPLNGTLREPDRDGIGRWLAESEIDLKARYFEQIKAQWIFMNDEIDQLYLAAHLWTREFPTMFGAQDEGERRQSPMRTTSGDLAATLRKKYGKCRSADVTRAMELLERGRFARRVSGSEWEVAWGPFQHEGDDVRRALAQRAESPPRDGNLGRLDRTRRARARAAQPQPTLWESLDEAAGETGNSTAPPPEAIVRKKRPSAKKSAEAATPKHSQGGERVTKRAKAPKPQADPVAPGPIKSTGSRANSPTAAKKASSRRDT